MKGPGPLTNLASQTCVPCTAGTPPMNADAVRAALAGLPLWTRSDDGRAILRRVEVKGFARAAQLANVAAWLGEQQGHHPDVRFGWGYCEVAFTTHAAGGITRNDLICAARLDALLAM